MPPPRPGGAIAGPPPPPPSLLTPPCCCDEQAPPPPPPAPAPAPAPGLAEEACSHHRPSSKRPPLMTWTRSACSRPASSKGPRDATKGAGTALTYPLVYGGLLTFVVNTRMGEHGPRAADALGIFHLSASLFFFFRMRPARRREMDKVKKHIAT